MADDSEIGNDLVPILISAAGGHATWRYIDFFTGIIGNSHTRRAYARACSQFLDWCAECGVALDQISSADVARYVQARQATHSATSVTQQLSAIRSMFDWLAGGEIIAVNPAAAVHAPKPAADAARKPVLSSTEWRRLVDSIPNRTLRDLRDRALICTLTYAFAPIGAALAMRIQDVRFQDLKAAIELPTKGGTTRGLPCHHALAEALRHYISAGKLGAQPLSPLFRSSPRRDPQLLTGRPMNQPDAWRMIRRRAQAAGIATPIGNHSIRATAITTYLASGGTLEHAQAMAGHRNPRTTQLYDPGHEVITQAEVERLRF